ncbi:hypothetical protein D1631_05755 [Chryseobacterium nematophagum]|uniref:Uncharacterized protein n=1 Tax=Chryseobacterium nematophagum TaxID=2305228 RepID=A0A3M7TDA8_9FLAO|nr:hypothetical protein D1631_05755 [Chryseobacterium nematophagum]
MGSDNDINEALEETLFKERFKYLNLNIPLPIDYNDVTYTYTRKYLSYQWYGKIIGLSAYYFPLFEKKISTIIRDTFRT